MQSYVENMKSLRFITRIITVINLFLCGTADSADGLKTQNLWKESAEKCRCDISLSCEPKYQVFPNHTACLTRPPSTKAIVLSKAEKSAIVNQHNEMRGRVEPRATNMLKMYWDNELAMIAKKWAENCQNHHEHENNMRDIPGRFAVGQNFGLGQKNFSQVINEWFAEKEAYRERFGIPTVNLERPKVIGHYTQIVWAATNKIGCGMAICNDINFYVCNYGPMGNTVPFHFPYHTGPRICSDCKKCHKGLCDCGAVTCANSGVLNVSTCKCQCKANHQAEPYSPSCQFKCNSVKDKHYCGGFPGYRKSDCGKYFGTQFACPKMCGICPCVDAQLSPAVCDTSPKGSDAKGNGSADSESGAASVIQNLVIFWALLLQIVLLKTTE